jgi:glycosyltransferase involved in cell wall biosynthesis
MAKPKKKINVLLVIQPTDGGSAAHVLQLARLLDRQRFELTVACPAVRSFTDTLDQLNVRVVPWSITRSINPLQWLNPFSSLLSLVWAEKFDVVHLHCTAAGVIGRFVCRLAGVKKIVYTPHGFIYGQTTSSLKRCLFYCGERWTLPLVHTVILVSLGEQRRATKDKLLPIAKIAIIENGISSARPKGHISPALPAQFQKFSPCIMMVGRLDEPKRPALSFLSRDMREAGVVFAGVGHKMAELQRLSDQLGLTDRILFLGWRTDVDSLLSVADVLVLCSADEGMPYTLLEGMRAGKPLVGTNVKGISDVIINDVNGLLYPLGQPTILALRLKTILGQPELAKRLGSSGQKLIKQRFNEKLMVAGIEAVYQG